MGTTFGQGGQKAAKLKKQNEIRAAKHLKEVLSKCNDLEGLQRLEYQLATVKSSIIACEYDLKTTSFKNDTFIQQKLNRLKAEKAGIEKAIGELK